MREIHSIPQVKENFVVVRGNSVSQFDISKALREFEKARKRCRETIMLKVFVKASTIDMRRTKKDNSLIYVDSDNVIRLYESLADETRVKIQGKNFTD